MSSTVTTATIESVNAQLFYGTLGLLITFIILSLLLSKEILLRHDNPIAIMLRRALNVAIVPLVLVFGVIAALNIVEFIR